MDSKITEYENALRILAVLFVKEPIEGYVDYFRRSRALASWLLPDASANLPVVEEPRYHPEFDGYTVQELAKIWRIDFQNTARLLAWAKEEVAKHDASYPQTSFAFQYTAPARVPAKISTAKTAITPRRGL